ncbi:hypothetical protein BC940DRAFT_289528 [Gongronella butleri]|nr:hypothetical protein BC940DRAFT_289528 [Gongronella butleri]
MLPRAALRVRAQGARQVSRRGYTGQSYETGTQGATASSGQFGEKEKAIENQWARAHDAEKLKILRKMLEDAKKTTENLEAKINEVSKKQ